MDLLILFKKINLAKCLSQIIAIRLFGKEIKISLSYFKYFSRKDIVFCQAS